MPAAVKDSLRDMLYLARNADVAALRQELAQLEARADAIRRLLEWNESIAKTYGDLDQIMPPNPAAPKAVKVQRNDSVDSRDPPPRPAKEDGAPVATRAGGVEEDADGENVLEADTPEAIAATKELLGLPPQQMSRAFVGHITKLVNALGAVGKGQSLKMINIIAEVGLTREFVQNFIKDPRTTKFVERTGFGLYGLTMDGWELYEGLLEQASMVNTNRRSA